jgi:hypothetical protein
VERELLAATHGQIFGLVMNLFQLETSEKLVELIRGIGTALRTPPEAPSPETSSDEAMETPEEKLERYRNAEQCEVSEPDLWATIHHGPPEDAEEEAQNDDAR